MTVRNDLWTAWLRRPAGVALGRTIAALRPRQLAGLADALAGCAWVLRERRPLPAAAEQRLRRIELAARR